MKLKVLFLCATNGVQSPMAEALLKRVDPEHFEVTSAGIECGKTHPFALEVMKEIGINLEGKSTKSAGDVAGSDFDFVITMCEVAKSRCPEFPKAERVHWQFDELGGLLDETKQKRMFRSVRDQIAQRVRLFALVQVRFKTIEFFGHHNRPVQPNLVHN